MHGTPLTIERDELLTLIEVAEAAHNIDPKMLVGLAPLTFDHTAPKSRVGIPTEHVFTGLATLGVIFVLAAGIWIGRDQGAITVNHTRTIHVSIAQQYGKPSTTVDGAKISPNLSGLICDVYQTKATIICHR